MQQTEYKSKKVRKEIPDPTTLIPKNQYNKDKENLERKNWRC